MWRNVGYAVTLFEIFLFFGYRSIVVKNFKISFLLIKEGYIVFSPLRYKNFFYP
ncbi:MAG: hypothetical protein UV95_C0004G0057 [Candidatus Falkowbacteria bacterium GW2011_GWF2_43_32]|nr:MAG: hypothetical protein UV95_C0004G0057 [Candidatus Falkowbacteria bacterium GW2011_GWF2_43_32]